MADEEVQAEMPIEALQAEAPAQEVPAPQARVGLGVLYMTNHAEENEEIPASVLEVYEDGSVRLAVSTGFTASPVSFDASGAPGTWRLPPKE